MVPTTIPMVLIGVAGLCSVAVIASDDEDVTTAPTVEGLANPKSISLAPLLVSMMLAGLRSRWVMPSRWALVDTDLQEILER